MMRHVVYLGDGVLNNKFQYIYLSLGPKKYISNNWFINYLVVYELDTTHD